MQYAEPSNPDTSAFSAGYHEARDKFLLAAEAAGASLQSFECPAKGPEGEVLFTDIAWVGHRSASKVLVALSATHGVEGFCGSGFQVDWLRSGRAAALPADTAVLFVHALNPHGFAWLRRVNEEGVDLNRNYLQPGKPLPTNAAYDAMAHALVPESVDGPAAVAADAFLAEVRARLGELAFFRAVASGQYTDPQGLFYGGSGPTWSNRTLHAIMAAYLTVATDIAAVDFHTGLGPFGYGDLITDYEPGSDGSARVRQFWGDSVSETRKGQALPLVMDGPTHFAFNRALTHARVTFGTLEFGTYDRETGRKALRADHWLHKHGDPRGPQAAAIKQALRRQYYPDTADWKEAVLFRGHQVVRMALEGLHGHHAERGAPPLD
ncbi:MAG: hypothetical protein JWQ11_4633 [Rhizobacter sp.]|nr:hypothetical protein [Rhizobacter sp.]